MRISAELDSVVAVTSNNVWAIGQMNVVVGEDEFTVPLIERWNGAAWSVVASPARPQNTDSFLRSIAAVPGTNQLWAVGYSTTRDAPASDHALIERWNGSAWQVVPNPTMPTGAFEDTINGVVAFSSTDAWAVGAYESSDFVTHTLIAHWDGTKWQLAPSPDVWGDLMSVAASGPSDVRAVGYIQYGDGTTTTALVEQWDGTAWHVATPAVTSW